MLQVALGQHGCEAYRRTALKLEQAKTTEGATIKVVVHEVDGALQETPAPLGAAPFARSLVKVSARVHGRRGRRKSGVDKEEEEEEAPKGGQVTGEWGWPRGVLLLLCERHTTQKNPSHAHTYHILLSPPPGPVQGVPVLWVCVDPSGEWLALIRVSQPEAMLAAQLERSHDLLAQHAALVKLVDIGATAGVMTALARCLQDSGTFCRLRMDAALALGSLSSDANGHAGLVALRGAFVRQCCRSDGVSVRPNRFSDMAEYYVTQVCEGCIPR